MALAGFWRAIRFVLSFTPYSLRTHGMRFVAKARSHEGHCGVLSCIGNNIIQCSCIHSDDHASTANEDTFLRVSA